MLKYFKSSFILFGLGLIAAFFIGGIQATTIVAILCILEISLSFDNAVVNAKKLNEMDDVWRHRFLTWGMLIAVFGMRIIFPIIIVAIVAAVTPYAAAKIAFTDPDLYAKIMHDSHVAVAAFGGTFLLMVFLKFFFDKEKDVHWIRVIEEPLIKLGRLDQIETLIAIIAIIVMSKFTHEPLTFAISGLAGLVTYLAIDSFSALLEEHESQKSMAGTAVKSGLAGFLYLETLDASFSFDGVIGAFAITHDIIIIAIGLGVGAMFVRSMTLMLVDKGTLGKFRYLEHGAFYAIGALATLMYVGTLMEVSEIITGLIGAGFIVLALYSSIRYNKLNLYCLIRWRFYLRKFLKKGI